MISSAIPSLVNGNSPDTAIGFCYNYDNKAPGNSTIISDNAGPLPPISGNYSVQILQNDVAMIACNQYTYQLAVSTDNGASWTYNNNLYNQILYGTVVAPNGSTVSLLSCFSVAKTSDDITSPFYNIINTVDSNIRGSKYDFGISFSVEDNIFYAYFQPVNDSSIIARAAMKLSFPFATSADGVNWSFSFYTVDTTPYMYAGSSYNSSSAIKSFASFFEEGPSGNCKFMMHNTQDSLPNGASAWYGYPSIHVKKLFGQPGDSTSTNPNKFKWKQESVESMKAAASALVNNDSNAFYTNNLLQPFMSYTPTIMWDDYMGLWLILDPTSRAASTQIGYKIYNTSGVLYYSADLITWGAEPIPNSVSLSTGQLINVGGRVIISSNSNTAGHNYVQIDKNASGVPVYTTLTTSGLTSTVFSYGYKIIYVNQQLVIVTSVSSGIKTDGTSTRLYKAQYSPGNTSIAFSPVDVVANTTSTLKRDATYFGQFTKPKLLNGSYVSWAVGTDNIIVKITISTSISIDVDFSLSGYNSNNTMSYAIRNAGADYIDNKVYAVYNNQNNYLNLLATDFNNQLLTYRSKSQHYNSNQIGLMKSSSGTYLIHAGNGSTLGATDPNGPWTSYNSNSYGTALNSGTGYYYLDHKVLGNGNVVVLTSSDYNVFYGGASSNSYVNTVDSTLTTRVFNKKYNSTTNSRKPIYSMAFSSNGDRFLFGATGGYYNGNYIGMTSELYADSYVDLAASGNLTNSTDKIVSLLYVEGADNTGLSVPSSLTFALVYSSGSFYIIAQGSPSTGEPTLSSAVKIKLNPINSNAFTIGNVGTLRKTLAYDKKTRSLLVAGFFGIWRVRLKFIDEATVSLSSNLSGNAMNSMRAAYAGGLTVNDGTVNYFSSYGRVKGTLNY